ncbi:uncharacterized protein LOC131858993 [Cryptomeria japonica]|uniref:uncharacterized protein LOC131858993 n=1 Tax=Cryptomeria japonica TaxID=3369 RepID=UPI0027DA4CB6|nr:uncharacterized protein LOC131858993 [Cryptomeria japonica]
MFGIDESIVIHNIILHSNDKPVKKKIRKINPKAYLLVKTEIKKLLKVIFIRLIDYSPWISNIVLVIKLDGHIHVCINFHDLNKASLKDDFPLLNIDSIVDSIAGYEDIVDAGVLPQYRDWFQSNPFPRFMDLAEHAPLIEEAKDEAAQAQV